MTSSTVPRKRPSKARQPAVSTICRSLHGKLATAELPGHQRGFAMARTHLDHAAKDEWREIMDVALLGRANVDAAAESGKVMVKGAESLAKDMVAYGRALFDFALGTTGEVLQARSGAQVIGLQTDFIRHVFESQLEQQGNLAEKSVAIAKDALRPLQARVWAAKETTVDPYLGG